MNASMKSSRQTAARRASGRRAIFDVAIAGGGLAGAALAVACAKAGLSVALVEPRAPDAGEGKAEGGQAGGPERVIALSRGSRDYLDELGAWAAIEREGVAPIREVHVLEPGLPPRVRMRERDAGVDALGYVAGNESILRALYAAMPDAVTLRSPARVEAVEPGEDAVRLTVRRLGRGGRPSHLSCRLLVAADGTESRVRAMCGIRGQGWDHNRFGIVASVRPRLPHQGVAWECFRPAGPLAFLPLDAARLSIVWTLPPRRAAEVMAMNDADFLRALERDAGEAMARRLGGLLETGPRAAFPFEFRLAARLTAPRVALIGNAAHTLHPVAGQGLNLGLRDVAVLADALARARAAGRDVGAPIVLEEYSQRRWPDDVAVAAFTEGLNAVFANDLLPLKLARGAGLACVQALPPLKAWLMRRATGLAQAPSLAARAGEGA